jgi:hypothetical protein
MKLGMMFAGLLAITAAACTSETDSSSGGKTGPVASSPLAGTIEGKSFTGKFAVARKSGFDDDPAAAAERMISIYDREVPCSSFSAETDAYLLLSVPWKAGTARDFSFGGKDSQTATFVVKKDGETVNVISTQGRVEILDAPTEAGAKGKLRLRAAADGNNVEGEVSVEVCE